MGGAVVLRGRQHEKWNVYNARQEQQHTTVFFFLFKVIRLGSEEQKNIFAGSTVLVEMPNLINTEDMRRRGLIF